MGWLETLKAIFNLEINSPIISVNITKNSNNPEQKQYYYDPNEKRLDINLSNLSNDNREKIGKLVKDHINDGKLLLENRTSKLLHRLNDFRKSKTHVAVLDFFKNLIPLTDYEALEASLFLRHIFTLKGDVTKLKRDIRERFGERGKNIANLCTAGYFEQFLIPLYNSSKERFFELYDVIVSKSPVAVFVHENMQEEQIISELRSKVEISKRYGIKFIHIHGIGNNNVFRVKQFIREQRDYIGFFDKDIYEKENIIIVELIIK